MANLSLIIGCAALGVVVVALALIADNFRQASSAAQEALAMGIARHEQSERALQAQVTALEEQLAACNTALETQKATFDEAVAALKKKHMEEGQAAQDYRQTFDAQLADNDRLHADLVQTVSRMTDLWQKLRAAAAGDSEALKDQAPEDSATPGTAILVPGPLELPVQEDAAAQELDLPDPEAETLAEAVPAVTADAGMPVAIS